MDAADRIKKIGERWFLTEPLLFATYCSHNVIENDSMIVPVRTGNRRIEFSLKYLNEVTNSTLENLLKIEMFRILLKHPYQRQLPFANKALLTIASNVTIADVYEVPNSVKQMSEGMENSLPHGLCFEEYYRLLSEQKANDGAQMECNKQISELWKDDEEACCDINGIIENAMECDTWGSIPGSLQDVIKASLKVDMDYRKMLSLFKTSFISSKRRFTRMRPNRRFGFDAMGSRYELSTNLLIAVDVSGSVSDKSLSFFFSVINRLFKYGVQKLDVLQFDSEIKDEPEPFKKAHKSIKIMGRGGTNFQPAADYYCKHPEYDGLIFFTDGYAVPPIYNTKRAIDVLWVLCGKSSYELSSEWIKKIKRNRVTYIPRNE